jgi:hypothetical protein
MRSLCIARGVRQRWPRAEIAFIVSREAPYAEDVPFRTFHTPRSPTKHIREVNRIVSEFRPEIMVFDCSGRKAQLRHAKRSGCATIFVSQHKKKRGRGFRYPRMRFTDLHWIVQPRFVDGELSGWERAKLRILGRPRISFIGPVFPPPGAPVPGLPSPPYFVCCAGAGGTRTDGRDTSELFAEQAGRVAGETEMQGVAVMGPNYRGQAGSFAGLAVVPSLDGAEMTRVLGEAEFALVGGGDLLAQTVALGTPCVAAAVGKDQASRIAAFQKEGLCLSAEPGRLAETCVAALTESERDRLRQNMRASDLRNGLDEALNQISELLEAGGLTRPPSAA